jgi:creatinase
MQQRFSRPARPDILAGSWVLRPVQEIEMLDRINSPRTFSKRNGNKSHLPFSDAEYHRRLSQLRGLMIERDLPVVVLTSMHNIAYYSGFLCCSFGRPFGCVLTRTKCTTISANIDGGQPWRRPVDDNVIYTDWRRDNF